MRQSEEEGGEEKKSENQIEDAGNCPFPSAVANSVVRKGQEINPRGHQISDLAAEKCAAGAIGGGSEIKVQKNV